jgi:hypothetical protein
LGLPAFSVGVTLRVGLFITIRHREAFGKIQPVPNLFRYGNLLNKFLNKLAMPGFSLQSLTRIDLRFLIYDFENSVIKC